MAGLSDIIKAMKDEDGNLDTNKITGMVMSVYKNRPGFFSPFRSFADFSLTLTTPISIPLLMAVITGTCALGIAVAAVTCVGSFLFAAASAPFHSEIASTALVTSMIAGFVTFACIICTGLFAIAAALAAPLFGVCIAARSIATLTNGVCGASVGEEEEAGIAFEK